MPNAYIALGSNLDDPAAQLRAAIKILQTHPVIEIEKISSFYRSAFLGDTSQPDCVNAVAKINTSLDAHALLAELLAIETQQGRVRSGEKLREARTLDLDLLLFNQEIINAPRLTVPHPGLTERAFVIYPLLEIEPDLVLPSGVALHSLQDKIENNLSKI